MTQQPLDAFKRFGLLDAQVKISPFEQSKKEKCWAVYGHPASKAMQTKTKGWARVAVRETEAEIRAFCAEWGLNIIEDEA